MRQPTGLHGTTHLSLPLLHIIPWLRIFEICGFLKLFGTTVASHLQRKGFKSLFSPCLVGLLHVILFPPTTQRHTDYTNWYFHIARSVWVCACLCPAMDWNLAHGVSHLMPQVSPRDWLQASWDLEHDKRCREWRFIYLCNISFI